MRTSACIPAKTQTLLGLESDLRTLTSLFYVQGIFLFHFPRQCSQHMISEIQRILDLSLSGSFTKRVGPNVVLCSLVCVCVLKEGGLAGRQRARWVGREAAEDGEFTHSKEPNKFLLGNPSFKYFLLPFFSTWC